MVEIREKLEHPLLGKIQFPDCLRLRNKNKHVEYFRTTSRFFLH